MLLFCEMFNADHKLLLCWDNVRFILIFIFFLNKKKKSLNRVLKPSDDIFSYIHAFEEREKKHTQNNFRMNVAKLLSDSRSRSWNRMKFELAWARLTIKLLPYVNKINWLYGYRNIESIQTIKWKSAFFVRNIFCCCYWFSSLYWCKFFG